MNSSLFSDQYLKYKRRYIQQKFIMEGGSNTEDQKKINKVIVYAKTLINVPYRWHRDGDKIQGDDKFWAKNAPHVTRDEINTQDKCIVCTGLINLMRRFLGLSIPGLDGSLNDIEGDKFPGTTGIWFNYLLRKNRLEKLDVKKKYPKGTLILKNFEDVENDQGHVAVIIDDNADNILEQKIIHAYAQLGYNESKNKKNVGKTGTMKFKFSHYFASDKGYYTHICLPKNWLLIN